MMEWLPPLSLTIWKRHALLKARAAQEKESRPKAQWNFTDSLTRQNTEKTDVFAVRCRYETTFISLAITLTCGFKGLYGDALCLILRCLFSLRLLGSSSVVTVKNMPEKISISDFVSLAKEDLSSPGSSGFQSKMSDCRSTVAALEEVRVFTCVQVDNNTWVNPCP